MAERFAPIQPPASLEPDLARYLEQELGRVREVLDIDEHQLLSLVQLTRPVEKPKPYMIVAADGVGWDPGEGPGAYIYDPAMEQWRLLLGTSPGGPANQITGLTVVEGSDRLEFSWNALPSNVQEVEVYRSPDNQFANATIKGTVNVPRFVDPLQGYDDGYYFFISIGAEGDSDPLGPVYGARAALDGANLLDHSVTRDKLVGLRVPAGQDVGGHRVVKLNTAHRAVYASADDADSAFTAVGVTEHAAVEGAPVLIQNNGELQHDGWAWMSGLPLFLGQNGHLVQTPPGGDYTLQVGSALSATRIWVRVERPLFLV